MFLWLVFLSSTDIHRITSMGYMFPVGELPTNRKSEFFQITSVKSTSYAKTSQDALTWEGWITVQRILLYRQSHGMVVYPSRDREDPQSMTVWDHSKFTIIVLWHMTEHSRKCPKASHSQRNKELQIWLHAEKYLDNSLLLSVWALVPRAAERSHLTSFPLPLRNFCLGFWYHKSIWSYPLNAFHRSYI